MNDAPSYAPPYELGKPMYGGAVGEVVAGGEAGLARGHQARLARGRAALDGGAPARVGTPGVR